MDDKDEDFLLLERISQGDRSALVRLMSKYKKSRSEFPFDQFGSPEESEIPLIAKLDSGERSPAVYSQTTKNML